MKRLQFRLAAAAMVGLLVQGPCLSTRRGAYGEELTRDSLHENRIRDVRLGEDGNMIGQVVNGAGAPLDQVAIKLHVPNANREIEVRTDNAGKFAIDDVPSGPAILEVCGENHALRIWRAPAAPPAAVQEILIVMQGEPTERGQQPISSLFCCQPVMLGILLAAAIAIPIAIHDSGDRPAASN